MKWLNEDAETAYEMLIANGSPEKLDGYCERHHIIPRSMGGTDDPENLVYLTASTHMYVHYWLWVGTGEPAMGEAYFHMSNTGRSKYDATPLVTEPMVRAYEEAKIVNSKCHSERMKDRFDGEKNPFFGKKHSANTRARLRKLQTGRIPSEETRKKMSKAQKGKIVSDETRAKLSAATSGSLHHNSKKALMKLDCGLTLSYGSAGEAARCLGAPTPTIIDRCRKGIKGFSYATNNDGE
jgi:hypothetical protein